MVVDTIPVDNLLAWARAAKIPCVISPESLGILHGAAVLLRPVFLAAVVGHDGGRRILFVNGQEVGDIRVVQLFGRAAHGVSSVDKQDSGRAVLALRFCVSVNHGSVMQITSGCAGENLRRPFTTGARGHGVNRKLIAAFSRSATRSICSP